MRSSTDKNPPNPPRRARGFHRAGPLVTAKVAVAAKRRGFVDTRLLLEWEAIVGPGIAAATRPVKMTRQRAANGSQGGGTLVVEANAARAPEVQMMLPTLKARVNAALGWPAVAHVRLVQSWGFAEASAPFLAEAPKGHAGATGAGGTERDQIAPEVDPARLDLLAEDVSSIGDGGLRAALETLARNVISRR